MSIEALLAESLQLLVLGMGSVFLILGMMILLVNMASKLLAHWIPEEPIAAGAGGQRPAPKKDSADSELVAVIQAAIHRYRSEHKTK